MIRLGRRGTIVAAAELGTYGLLLRASSREDLESFARRTLRPVLEHDRAHGGELLTTLRAYIDEDRVQRRVASRCFIHVNTVVYRVRRIETLLGVAPRRPRGGLRHHAGAASPRPSRRVCGGFSPRVAGRGRPGARRSRIALADLLGQVVPAHPRSDRRPRLPSKGRRGIGESLHAAPSPVMRH